MAHYLKRSIICERLRLSGRASYHLVGTAYGSLISSEDVVTLLNRARRADGEPFTYIPSDFATPEEMAAELTASGITANDLKNWTRRKKNVAPHVRLSRRTILFSRSRLMGWLDARSRLKSLKVRAA